MRALATTSSSARARHHSTRSPRTPDRTAAWWSPRSPKARATSATTPSRTSTPTWSRPASSTRPRSPARPCRTPPASAPCCSPQTPSSPTCPRRTRRRPAPGTADMRICIEPGPLPMPTQPPASTQVLAISCAVGFPIRGRFMLDGPHCQGALTCPSGNPLPGGSRLVLVRGQVPIARPTQERRTGCLIDRNQVVLPSRSLSEC